MIQKVDLEDSSGIGNAAGQARIGFRGAWVTGWVTGGVLVQT
jgi:hypothetical protein